MTSPLVVPPAPVVVRYPGLRSAAIALAGAVLGLALSAAAQSPTFAANAQHTGCYDVPAQHLDRVRWSTSVNLANNGSYAHYGAPLITASNTVVVPVRTASGFQVSAFEGGSGRLKYTLATDYALPAYNWLPVYQPVLAAGTSALRLYFPGAGGSVFYIEQPDSDLPGAPVRECFFTDLNTFSNNLPAFAAKVFVNTPISADTNGTIYFGFRVSTNGAPAPLNTTNGGYARIDAAGNATYVLAGAAAGNSAVLRESHNCAPALSNDGSTLYVVVKDPPYLLGLDATNLGTKYRVRLTSGSIPDDSTASPVVAPDNDVFFGVYTGSRGLMLHFNTTLTVQKTPGGFGWDFTPALVPASMVPNYQGNSAYLLFCKYNNYASGGDGVNRIALLDPGATEVSPLLGGMTEMREVFSVIGCTPDPEYLSSIRLYAVREWCINTAAVNPATGNVFVPSEDGRLYCWNLAANSLTESIRLGSGVGEPYVPTAIGPDGAVYALNGGKLFVLESNTNVAVSISSSAPDLRSVAYGEPLTFTALVKNPLPNGPQPTGSIIFQDVTYLGLTPVTNILDTEALVDGVAMLTTSNLLAGSNCLGSHFITAAYSGDDVFQPGSATLVQKIHARATALNLTASPAPAGAISLTATVSPTGAGTGVPTGLVSFWQDATLLGQKPLSTNGVAVLTSPNVTAGLRNVTALYCSDTVFASSTASLVPAPVLQSVRILANGAVQVSFSSLVSGSFTVLGSADPSLPLNLWTELGAAGEVSPGQFQFSDLDAMNHSQRFYNVRSP